MACIELDRLSLTFRIKQQGRISLKDFLVRQIFQGFRSPVTKIRALQDINLKIHEGERVGILGHNGAGKSTLLKVLAGIYPPTRGQRLVRGQISSLFDIALGFEDDENGWENISYRGFLQGERPRSILAKMTALGEFR